MMIIDSVDAFKVLKHYGIHAARSKIVDSPEDAISFAERRDARDPRLMPILLRGSDIGSTSAALKTEHAIRRAYEHLAQAGHNRKIRAQEVTEAGTDIEIAGRAGPNDGKLIEVRSATHSVERMIPLGSAGAEFLATNFQAHHHHDARDKERRMLEHLLLRVSAFFEHSGVSDFSLTIRLHENSYTVVDASMKAPEALHLKDRLDAHAHDRKAADYHPAGRE